MNADLVARLATFLKPWLKLRYDQIDWPGFAVAIGVDDRLVFNEAFGFANLEQKEKLTNDHLFRVASHSKTFTGTALMQLAAAGKVALDAPVVKYLPWLAEHKDKRFLEITTRQLLSHSAGVIRDGLDADCWQFKKPFPEAAALQAGTLDADLIFDSNIKMKYSNWGYGLLGLLVEAVSGVTYNEYVQKNIIEPLALKSTGPDVNAQIAPRLASAYSRMEADGAGGRKRQPLDSGVDTRALAAATGFYSSAADLCAYFSAHVVGSGKLLDDASKKEMQRTQWPVTNSTFNQEYGLGLQVDLVGSRRVIGHAGGFPGMATRTLCDPSAKIVVSVLTNCIDADPTAVCRAIFAFFDYFESNEQVWARPQKSAEADHNRFEGRFVGLFKDMQIIAAGKNASEKRYIAFNPGSWTPLADIEELSVAGAESLKMTRANGFSCEGEEVHFHFDRNMGAGKKQADAITCGGMTLAAPAVG
jgi:D-alanyl-D-alanine carboxypeptidase